MEDSRSLLLGSHIHSLDKIINFASPDHMITHIIPSKWCYFNYETHYPELIVDGTDIEIIDYSIFKTKTSTNVTNTLPTNASILKLRNNDIVLFIPYTKLIKITKDKSTSACWRTTIRRHLRRSDKKFLAPGGWKLTKSVETRMEGVVVTAKEKGKVVGWWLCLARVRTNRCHTRRKQSLNWIMHLLISDKFSDADSAYSCI